MSLESDLEQAVKDLYELQEQRLALRREYMEKDVLLGEKIEQLAGRVRELKAQLISEQNSKVTEEDVD